jgi:hypothetical protein
MYLEPSLRVISRAAEQAKNREAFLDQKLASFKAWRKRSETRLTPNDHVTIDELLTQYDGAQAMTLDKLAFVAALIEDRTYDQPSAKTLRRVPASRRSGVAA